MESSIDLLTKHIWTFLNSFEEFDYTNITFLPPDTILQFSSGRDKGFGMIARSKPIKSHDYCLEDIVWNRQTWISKSGGAIDLYPIKSTDIIQVCGDLSLKWKKVLDTLKEYDEKMKKHTHSFVDILDPKDVFHHNLTISSFNSSIEDYLLGVREDLYLRLILSHRNDEPRPYP
jgi:hypothetical protein